MTDDDGAKTGLPPVSPRLSRFALFLTGILLAAVLVLMPAALVSFVDELFGQEANFVYDLTTGVAVDASQIISPATTFLNVTVTHLDEARRIASLTVSGHRVCEALCPPITGTFFSLGNDAARRRGLPPSASFTVPNVTGAFTFTMELPVRGTPQRYPFDSYTLLLGTTASATGPGGLEIPVTEGELERRNVSFTLEDQVARLNMKPPRLVDPAAVRSPNDPADFLLVDQLEWQRPIYLRILSVLLVLLISASGIFALGLRSLNELLLGIGGIILGIWGVRSVVVQSPLPDVTLIDLILGFVMLTLLLALALRAARHFYNQSGLRL
ncbi:MAG: hypothetical protein H0V00_10485, partial [Chloroflexia bacterium]|nr:hypothetical protein [Chloroflexia bacterium]